MNGLGDLNLKFPLILAISAFMSSLNFMLSIGDHEKSFITSWQGYSVKCKREVIDG